MPSNPPQPPDPRDTTGGMCPRHSPPDHLTLEPAPPKGGASSHEFVGRDSACPLPRQCLCFLPLRPSTPLAFRAIMTRLQPTTFLSLVKGSHRECPCCGRRFADAS